MPENAGVDINGLLEIIDRDLLVDGMKGIQLTRTVLDGIETRGTKVSGIACRPLDDRERFFPVYPLNLAADGADDLRIAAREIRLAHIFNIDDIVGVLRTKSRNQFIGIAADGNPHLPRERTALCHDIYAFAAADYPRVERDMLEDLFGGIDV